MRCRYIYYIHANNRWSVYADYIRRTIHVIQDEQSDEDSDSQWVEKRFDSDIEDKPAVDNLKRPENQVQVCLINILRYLF